MPSSPRFFHFRDRPDWSPSNLNIDVSSDKGNPPGARRRAGRPFAKIDEHPVRYFGYYSNKSRCLRKKAQADDQIPAIMPNEMSSSKFRQNWARLIQKIYEVDPLICPKCQGPTRIIAFIEDDRIVQKLLTHLGLWEIHNHDPPSPDPSQPPEALTYDDFYSQIPPIDYWLQ